MKRRLNLLLVALVVLSALPAAAAVTPAGDASEANPAANATATENAREEARANYTRLYIDTDDSYRDAKPGESLEYTVTVKNGESEAVTVDPHLFAGVGNAYSDEILFAAGLSPFKLTQSASDEDLGKLHRHAREVLTRFTEAMRSEIGDGFPDKVTAFRDDMYVHGRYREPCRVCGTKIQRVAYAENEMNYCPTCQNQGRLLADRSLSRLLKKDWPKTVDELEGLRSS